MDTKEKTRERVRKHRRIQSALANVASCSHFSDDANVTYEHHGDIVNKILQFTSSDISNSDTSNNDANESAIQYSEVNANTSDNDEIDFWQHNDSTETDSTYTDVDQSENDTEIEELRKWALTCNIPIKHLDKLLSILRTRLLPNLPQSGKTFLNTSKATYNIQPMKGIGDCVGEYVYLGIENGLNRCVDIKVHRDETIFLQINVDGASPYHSSTKQLWPILCKVFFSPDIYSPFPVTLYYGNTKPGNIDEYMNDFIEELNILQKDGVYINEKKYAVQLKHIICDIPARKFLKQIKGHGGYAACERCEVIGTHVGFPTKRIVYPDHNCRERTDESFRVQRQKEHHVNITPLLRIEPPIDLIHTFPLDYMHMCCLGIVKKFYVMDLLFNKTSVRLKSTLRQKLSERMEFIKPFVPDEFQRKPRPFVANLKASELRFIVLYAGPVIFKKILSSHLYNHFLLLHCALRILCTKNIAQTFNETARSYLRHYFLLLPKFFGEQSYVINVHYLIHLADDVRQNYTLNDLSAFPFENYLGFMRKLLRTANKPLAQICRRINEQNIIHKKAKIPPACIIMKQKRVPDNRQLLLKLKYKNYFITTKQPNNIIMLNNDMIIKIISLGYRCETDVTENDVKITGVCWSIKKPIFQYPMSSADLNMWQLKEKPSEEIIKFQLKDIKFKMILIRLPYERNNQKFEKVFSIPLLHM